MRQQMMEQKREIELEASCMASIPPSGDIDRIAILEKKVDLLIDTIETLIRDLEREEVLECAR